MVSKQELEDINIKLPQAIAYIANASSVLINTIAELEYERDEYRKKYLNEVKLRALKNEK